MAGIQAFLEGLSVCQFVNAGRGRGDEKNGFPSPRVRRTRCGVDRFYPGVPNEFHSQARKSAAITAQSAKAMARTNSLRMTTIPRMVARPTGKIARIDDNRDNGFATRTAQ